MNVLTKSVTLLALLAFACGQSSQPEDASPADPPPSFHVIEAIPEHLAQLASTPGASLGVAVYVVTDHGTVAAGSSDLRVMGSDGSFVHSQAVFRWTEGTGTVALGDLPTTTPPSIDFPTTVNDMNPSGSVLVGETSSGRAFRWTESGGMVDISPANSGEQASALFVSDDGYVVVGYALGQAYRWTERTGSVLLGAPDGSLSALPLFMSDDGEVVAGVADGSNALFRWTRATGMTTIAALPDCTSYQAQLTWPAVSYAPFMAGTCTNGAGVQQLFIWSDATGLVGIAAPSGRWAVGPRAVGTHGDTVVGIGEDAGGTPGLFRWTRASRATEELDIPAEASSLSAPLYREMMSVDGAVVVADTGNVAYRWSERAGTELLAPLLTSGMSSVSGVSGDGRTVVGRSSGTEPVVWSANTAVRLEDFLNDSGLPPTGITTFDFVQVGRSGRLLYGTGENTSYGVGWIAWLPQ